ncbi:chaperone modulator CbpM [Dongshaea marina]|uniref:chaperone modulator CbpM n=1 Tax=Dongshaea marina TaxID=2047966 RepID=UPI000D3ED41A|nr:chaperone modulator CbpM [Dongshaea marina]
MGTQITVTQTHILDQQTRYSLVEICECEHICAEVVVDLVSHGVIDPVEEGALPSRWQFDVNNFFRLRRALRLQRDLKLNLPGIAVASDLLDELDELRRELAQLKAKG